MIQLQQDPIVQKYGGSSLSTLDKVRDVAGKILRSAAGRPTVVVVSAMGNTTSELIERAQQLSPSPPRREVDVLLSSGERMTTALLAMAIEEEGGSAISLTGPQSGILTDDRHTSASILDVRPLRVAEELEAGNVVIVAGFQGMSPAGEVTTLGRGGSDTTAVALAGALGAECCEIFSDVPGVYTADPRIVDHPMHLAQVDSRLMTEYALHGARVLHPTCIDLAHRHGVAIHARSTFHDELHTRIRSRAALTFSDCGSDAPTVVGVTSRKSRLHVRGRGEETDLIDRVKSCVDDGGILRSQVGAMNDLLVDIEDVPDPDCVTAALKERVGSVATVTESIASVSIVTQPVVTSELAERIVTLLKKAGARLSSIYRRPHSVTCALHPEDRESAVRVLHCQLVEESFAVGA